MKKHFLITALILLSVPLLLNGQGKKWSLEDCINYAVTNNLSLQRQRLQTEINKTDLLQSKMAVLPSINAGSDGRVGFGRSVDPVTNLITFKQNISHSYYITSGVTIFNGFSTLNTIAANKFMLKAGIETEKVQRNALIIDILGQYYLVVYTSGLERASEMQLESSEEQLRRISKMVETGKEALSKLYEIQSRVSSDRLDHTIARNTAEQAVTSLRQMLQLNPGEEFIVEIPDQINIPVVDETFEADSIYSIAARTLPGIRAVEYQLEAHKKQFAAAKGIALPGVTAGGQIFTGYYRVLGEDEGASPQISYSTQLKNNNSQAIFLALEIPLFNNYRTGRNIKLARLRRDDTALRLELEKNALYTQIENACLDYNRGKDEFLAANSNLEFNNKSFEAVEKKFESGLVDVSDYSVAKTSLFRAEMEQLRTSLQLLIRRMTITFYTSGEYEDMFR